MQIPVSSENWTYDVIVNLCAVGVGESDRHDFKLNLPDAKNMTKICCSFANTFGGFIIFGVKDVERRQFEIIGLDPDKELYGQLRAKVNAEPEILIQPPKKIEIPSSNKLLYVVHISKSVRSPHLPSIQDQRVFWKRKGSDCVQMTLEEVRYQMNTYEEKREKLTLLLLDLHHKLRSITDQSSFQEGYYNGDIYSFEIFDRVVIEAFTFLKSDVNIIGSLDMIRRSLMAINAEKQKLLAILSMSYSNEFKHSAAIKYREAVRGALPELTIRIEQIERSLNERFGIENPYKQNGHTALA